MRDTGWPIGGYLAEFADLETLRHATRALVDSGYQALETYTPFPDEEVAKPLPDRRSRLPLVVLIGGLTGGLLSYAIQWYANAYDYPLDIGGRPAHAIPAFIVPTFEGTVLLAALAGFVGLMIAMGLPRLWHPVFEVDGFERATVDRFWLGLDGRDPRLTPSTIDRELAGLGALRVVRVLPS